MISHEYRCIFIHIPRTGGTSIERALCGKDWWFIDRPSKHMIASQARRLYQEHWDEYFKFAFVRNPGTRMLSCLKYPEYFSVNAGSHYSFSDFLRGYMHRFGYPVTVEFDHRFHETATSRNALPNAVYMNMLDEELDYVGHFERLEEDFAAIVEHLGIPKMSLEKTEMSPRKLTVEDIDDESRVLLDQMFQRDFVTFDYQLDARA